MRNFAKNLALVLISVCFATAIAEGLLRLSFGAETFRYGWEADYWRALRKTEGCSAPEHGDLEIDKNLGWRMRRGYSNGATSHDENGYRNSTGRVLFPASRPIVAIGDSFTYGLGLPDSATYSSRLQELTGRRVLNFGVNGFAVDQALMYWESEARAFKPDLVVLGYFSDNFHRNAHRIRGLPKPGYDLLPDGSLEAFAVGNCDDLVEGVSLWRLPTLIQWSLRKFLDKAAGYPVQMLEQRRDLSRAVLSELRDSVAAEGASLVVLLIPHCAHPQDGAYGDWVLSRTKTDCSELGLNCIDFSDKTDVEDFGNNCHWSAATNSLAAERIIQMFPQFKAD
ncbi:SGNH/GDSL hydrolase family protein [Ruegeria arenilitoris]|uniref:SGNH/GDSL hydrolase family protein n=1 Tax=Ruegeria arenilitoris TaxID=1173585 RepID=UPI00147B6CA7|nr:SGNH/GDSL hydrolase family protein [Ruegeria arenilitoris]